MHDVIIFDKKDQQAMERIVRYACDHVYTDSELRKMIANKRSIGDNEMHACRVGGRFRIVMSFSHGVRKDNDKPVVVHQVSISENGRSLPSDNAVIGLLYMLGLTKPIDQYYIMKDQIGINLYAILINDIKEPEEFEKYKNEFHVN